MMQAEGEAADISRKISCPLWLEKLFQLQSGPGVLVELTQMHPGEMEEQRVLALSSLLRVVLERPGKTADLGDLAAEVDRTVFISMVELEAMEAVAALAEPPDQWAEAMVEMVALTEVVEAAIVGTGPLVPKRQSLSAKCIYYIRGQAN